MRGLRFVTCLCLTRNRRQWLPKAIECYQKQTYPGRELLIVADGEDVRDLLPHDYSIRLIHIEEGRCIGEKRNFGASQAVGDVIAHWDDDDYSAAGRLSDQLERLRTSGRAVTGYHNMRFRTDAGEWWFFSGAKGRDSLGTSLCYWRSWWAKHRFNSIHVGEDGDFVKEAFDARQLTTAEAGDLMYATIHAGNTSPRALGLGCWSKVS